MWMFRVPDSVVLERPHGLKYPLVYVKDGKLLVGYDNERGKGDYKHIGEKEQAYAFQSIDQLLEGFWNSVPCTSPNVERRIEPTAVYSADYR